MAVTTPIADIGWRAEPFRLKGVDGRLHTLRELAGPRGTLVMFICNHCPYVKAVLPRIVRDARELLPLGVHTIAINANDESSYPEDGFDRMKALSKEMLFPFHYLHDTTQDVARAYEAVCTPDFYGFDADLRLQYRGRLDASRRDPAPEDSPRELFDAMRLIAHYGYGPGEQWPSMGCSIKWKPLPQRQSDEDMDWQVAM
jgi:thiol-disulfide isomerase/thioredoxin